MVLENESCTPTTVHRGSLDFCAGARKLFDGVQSVVEVVMFCYSTLLSAVMFGGVC